MTTQEQLQAAVETATNLIEEKYEQASMTGTCSCYKDPNNACASCSAWERVTKQSKEVILTELQPIFDALVKENDKLKKWVVVKNCAQCHGSGFVILSDEGGIPAPCNCTKILEDQLHQANERVKELETQITYDNECIPRLQDACLKLEVERDSLKQRLQGANYLNKIRLEIWSSTFQHFESWKVKGIKTVDIDTIINLYQKCEKSTKEAI